MWGWGRTGKSKHIGIATGFSFQKEQNGRINQKLKMAAYEGGQTQVEELEPSETPGGPRMEAWRL